MSEAPQTIWVTKFALTRGILKCAVRVAVPWGTLWIVWPEEWTAAGLTPADYEDTREAAIARAEDMRVAEINRLKRQIAKLEALVF